MSIIDNSSPDKCSGPDNSSPVNSGPDNSSLDDSSQKCFRSFIGVFGSF